MYFVLLKNDKGQWYWQLRSTNHKIVAIGGETYHNRVDCLHSIDLVRKSADAVVKTMDGETTERKAR